MISFFKYKGLRERIPYHGSNGKIWRETLYNEEQMEKVNKLSAEHTKRKGKKIFRRSC